jgi:hypothetical protein
MSKKPKKSDYKASEAETASASVAQAEYDYFKQKYDPLLQQMRDKSLTEDVQSGLRGRANADTMQALSAPSYRVANSTTAAGDMAQAVTGQLGEANTVAKDVQNKMQTGVLSTARDQVSDAQAGMAQASRLSTSQALERAQANQLVADAKVAAVGKVVGTFIGQGLENMASSGVDAAGNKVQGTFFTPVNKQGQKMSSLSDRLAWSEFFGRRTG